MNTAYDHLVAIDREQRCIRIFRIMSDGEKVLYTELDLPGPDSSGWSDEVVKMAQRLGEDLLVDSPSAREILKL